MDARERDEVETIVADAVANAGCEVLALSLSGDRRLRITLDRDDGQVTIEHCTQVNRQVRREFIEAEIDVDDYHIEVESPGVGRPLITLRHFERFIGQTARIRLTEDVEGRETVVGTITDVSEGQVTVQWDGEWEISFTMDELVEAQLKQQWGKK